jgi:hypothetical protein
MPNQVIANPACNKRVPWNEGKLCGAKPPFRPKHVGQSKLNFRSKVALATLPSSI